MRLEIDVTKMDRLETLKEFLKTDPEDAFTRFALATEYAKRGHAETALEYFEALARDKPDYVGTYYHLGKLYEKLGLMNKASDVYRRGIKVARSQKDVHSGAELQSALLEAEGVGFDEDE